MGLIPTVIARVQYFKIILFYSFSESFYGRNAMTLGSTYRSTYSSTDYASAVRRSSLFDGYAGFSIYSSISQGNTYYLWQYRL